tara:strand:+ start:14451 stop:14735 length:285 start_codon:yes stop_codon:yes gene_type:complete
VTFPQLIDVLERLPVEALFLLAERGEGDFPLLLLGVIFLVDIRRNAALAVSLCPCLGGEDNKALTNLWRTIFTFLFELVGSPLTGNTMIRAPLL